MSNMSYCRFQNTLQDLKDCWKHLDDDNLSKEEKVARERLIKLCRDMVNTYLPFEEDTDISST